ncbi:Vitamin B12 dependent methionine synthase activation subunit [Lachnoclostridium sp. An169]|uniref:vitamin B12 dependent-methionine synthase activation domain-containing protein n=1 Tax=Lachnoclostridium sp. An169 TaxID=1965569 RepID=UPI000B385F82|nr:vitamin B12 dependent-methionine synthase activation domain-containing protein [Lachnoclostridium sp. An169]OUP84853.1 Vitamin B12 dependent methionine synthase activation subunit [Lachnoclostridium sp. An169]HJA67501.1 Vitamin B12 dependent methionine synthase activation subunit [Candidatus Mediterraneibacter cottocaccae]
MEKRIKEAVRYLGFGKNAADERTLSLIGEAFADLEKEADPRFVCRFFDITHEADGKIRIGTLKISSRSLERNLKGCGKIVLFGATLGPGVDRLITRTSVMDMAKAVIVQACAAAMLEEYCDSRQLEIGEELEREGEYLRPRFSPGYGDFDIHYQEPLMRMLDCAKTIGLTMTDSYMMSPSKSVTAVIGVSRTQERCPVEGCEACSKTDCEYRR